MKCEYGDVTEHMGPCEGKVKVRKAMTAYHFEGVKNSPEDPNRDFIACEGHYQGYHDHWKEMWDEYYRDVREGIYAAEYEQRINDRLADEEFRYRQEQENLAREAELEEEARYNRNRDWE